MTIRPRAASGARQPLESKSQALDILRRAALREAIPREHGVALARPVMSSTVLGRLCLAVLDEGQARALVELASAVCREIVCVKDPGFGAVSE